MPLLEGNTLPVLSVLRPIVLQLSQHYTFSTIPSTSETRPSISDCEDLFYCTFTLVQQVLGLCLEKHPQYPLVDLVYIVPALGPTSKAPSKPQHQPLLMFFKHTCHSRSVKKYGCKRQLHSREVHISLYWSQVCSVSSHGNKRTRDQQQQSRDRDVLFFWLLVSVQVQCMSKKTYFLAVT